MKLQVVPRPSLLEGPQVKLTALHFDNIRAHFRWRNDPSLSHVASDQPFQPESYRSFADRFDARLRHPAPGVHEFEIHRTDSTIIGYAFIECSTTHSHEASIGLVIGDTDARSHGYGHEALALLIDHAFKTLHLHHLSAEAFAFNTAWQALLNKANFQQETVRRDFLFRDGQYWDTMTYGLLASEYFGIYAQAA